MIQDIWPHQLDITYHHRQLAKNSLVICFDTNRVLVAGTTEVEAGAEGTPGIELRFPRCSELLLTDQQATYLFSIDDDDYFLIDPAHIKDNPGFILMETSMLRTMQPQHLVFAGLTAQHLHNWYDLNRICGRCGSEMQHDQVERMMFCEHCQNTVYPRIAPAVIVGVYHADELLLTRYAGRVQGRFALIAGFTEIGETAEETVHREVMEEVGLKVKNLQYYKSQPWGISGSLLMGFYAELDGDGEVNLDTNELSEAVWMHRDDIEVTYDNFSLTNEMIYTFKNGEAPYS